MMDKAKARDGFALDAALSLVVQFVGQNLGGALVRFRGKGRVIAGHAGFLLIGQFAVAESVERQRGAMAAKTGGVAVLVAIA